ncbi:MAG: hypothetical protein ACPGQL_07310 [Thermoplasmatota archaeon]
MSSLLNASAAVLSLVALAVTLLAFLGWRRSGLGKQLLLALGFGCFAAAGIVTSIGLFRGTSEVTLLTWQTLLAAVGVFMVYVAAVKR